MPYATSLPMAMEVRQMVKTIETAIALTGLYVALISRMVPRKSAAKDIHVQTGMDLRKPCAEREAAVAGE